MSGQLPLQWRISILTLLSSPLFAQLQPESPLAALRTVGLDPAGARAHVESLLHEPLNVRLQGSDLIRARTLEELRRHDRTAASVKAAVGKAAGAMQQRRFNAAAARRVELLRDEMLKVSRGAELTKERIHAELDPRLEELRSLLLLPLAQLSERQPDLQPKIQELRRSRRTLIEWHEVYVVATSDLELNSSAQRHFKRVAPPPTPPPLAELDRELDLAILLGLPMTGQDERALRDNELLRGSTDVEEFAGTAMLNEIRFLLGLPLVRIDPKLGEAARDHSRDMHELGFFAHESPVPGKRSFSDRAARFGTSGSAENIASGQATGAGAIRAWWYSPGHHRNMLGGHQRTGLGREAQMWTQMFGG